MEHSSSLWCHDLERKSQILCMVGTFLIRVWINRTLLPILPAYGQLNREAYFSVPFRAREFGLARQFGVRSSRPASAPSISIPRLILVLSHVIPPAFRDGVHLLMPPTAIGSDPSLSGHSIAYRWCLLPRARWDRGSSPQGSSSNGCCCRFRYYHGAIFARSLFPRVSDENVLEVMAGKLLMYVCMYVCMVITHSRV